MFEEWVLGWGKLVGWPVHTDFLRVTVPTGKPLRVSRDYVVLTKFFCSQKKFCVPTLHLICSVSRVTIEVGR